jgi:GNAT superfamily N-acetyltransferase
MSASIVGIGSVPYDVWRTLWLDYVGPLRDAMSEELHQATYSRLCAATDGSRGLCAVSGSAFAFAHSYLHFSTFSLSPACTLEDLYVAPEGRGKGIAKQLVGAVAQRARADGAYVLHWKTRETNANAMSLYDKIAARSGYICYRMELDAHGASKT